MLIVLDRDGVINVDSDDFIKTPDEWVPIPGSLEAIARLNRAGCLVVVATNQSGIGRGLFTEQDLKRIHKKMVQLLAMVGGHVDGIFYCPHHPDAHCNCRKPKPGMLIQIADQFHAQRSDMWVIGDAERDVECGIAYGCNACLVRTGKGMFTLHQHLSWKNVLICDDLASAVDRLLKLV